MLVIFKLNPLQPFQLQSSAFTHERTGTVSSIIRRKTFSLIFQKNESADMKIYFKAQFSTHNNPAPPPHHALEQHILINRFFPFLLSADTQKADC